MSPFLVVVLDMNIQKKYFENDRRVQIRIYVIGQIDLSNVFLTCIIFDKSVVSIIFYLSNNN